MIESRPLSRLVILYYDVNTSSLMLQMIIMAYFCVRWSAVMKVVLSWSHKNWTKQRMNKKKCWKRRFEVEILFSTDSKCPWENGLIFICFRMCLKASFQYCIIYFSLPSFSRPGNIFLLSARWHFQTRDENISPSLQTNCFL